MKKITYTLIAAVLITLSGTAQSKITKIVLEVDGLCGMCKERIENAAYLTGVKQVNWDKATHELDVVFRNDKVSEEQIIASINSAGHDVKGSLASAEQYKQIHGCCRFRDSDLRSKHGHGLGEALCTQEKK